MEHLNSFWSWVFGLCGFYLVFGWHEDHLTLWVLEWDLSASTAHLLFAFYAAIDQLWLPQVLTWHRTHHVAARRRGHGTSTSHRLGEMGLRSRPLGDIRFIIAQILVEELILVAVSIFALGLDLVYIWVLFTHALFAAMMLSVCYALLDKIAEDLKEIQFGRLLLLWDSDVQFPVLDWKRGGVLLSWGAGLGLWLICRSWCVNVLDTSTMLFLVAEYLLWH